mmetsp:Transcript_58643/g.132743  ORF Transcript_58643/g.132743 Transcript_58643/m.132743 type:complete len:207 (+) Transcript_58643:132-752(+)
MASLSTKDGHRIFGLGREPRQNVGGGWCGYESAVQELNSLFVQAGLERRVNKEELFLEYRKTKAGLIQAYVVEASRILDRDFWADIDFFNWLSTWGTEILKSPLQVRIFRPPKDVVSGEVYELTWISDNDKTMTLAMWFADILYCGKWHRKSSGEIVFVPEVHYLSLRRRPGACLIRAGAFFSVQNKKRELRCRSKLRFSTAVSPG